MVHACLHQPRTGRFGGGGPLQQRKGFVLIGEAPSVTARADTRCDSSLGEGAWKGKKIRGQYSIVPG